MDTSQLENEIAKDRNVLVVLQEEKAIGYRNSESDR